MVKRIILWKLKDDQNKQANLNLLKDELLGLASKIGDIVSAEVGLNYSSADFDIIFIVAFEDPFQLKQFQSNPEYLKIHQQAQTITINMIYCDYMVETVDSNGVKTPSAGYMGANSHTSKVPNLNNLASPSNLQPNMGNGGGMFGSIPKLESSLEGTKPFSPIGGKNSPPFAGGGFANSPNTPNAPSMPGSPNMPSAPGMPGSPNMPNASGMPGSPNMPSAPGMPGSPNMPGSSNASNASPYNGFGSANGDKNSVNFTTSEAVNQIRFAGQKGGMNSNEDTWKCSKCGKTNSSFINMCSCGRKKPVDGQNNMLLNSSLLPKVPSMPKPNSPGSIGAWMCPNCGKSNNDYLKVCVCGQRRIERNTPNNNGFNNNNNNNNTMGFGNPNIPKTPSMGAGNIKSPNNNEFFNNFGGPNPPGGMPGGPTGPNRMQKPMGGPNSPGSPNNMAAPGGMPGGMNSPGSNRNMLGNPNGMTPPGGPNNMPGGPNNNMSRLQYGGTNHMMPPNKGGSPGGPGNLPPDSWKCPRCGKVLGNFVGQCVCGQRKPSRPGGPGGPGGMPGGMTPPGGMAGGPGPNNTHMRFN